MTILLTLMTRLVPSGVFVVFGADEFVNHARNVRSFMLYGLPAPSAFSYAIGSIEIVGALALLTGSPTDVIERLRRTLSCNRSQAVTGIPLVLLT